MRVHSILSAVLLILSVPLPSAGRALGNSSTTVDDTPSIHSHLQAALSHDLRKIRLGDVDDLLSVRGQDYPGVTIPALPLHQRSGPSPTGSPVADHKSRLLSDIYASTPRLRTVPSSPSYRPLVIASSSSSDSRPARQGPPRQDLNLVPPTSLSTSSSEWPPSRPRPGSRRKVVLPLSSGSDEPLPLPGARRPGKSPVTSFTHLTPSSSSSDWPSPTREYGGPSKGLLKSLFSSDSSSRKSPSPSRRPSSPSNVIALSSSSSARPSSPSSERLRPHRSPGPGGRRKVNFGPLSSSSASSPTAPSPPRRSRAKSHEAEGSVPLSSSASWFPSRPSPPRRGGSAPRTNRALRIKAQSPELAVPGFISKKPRTPRGGRRDRSHSSM